MYMPRGPKQNGHNLALIVFQGVLFCQCLAVKKHFGCVFYRTEDFHTHTHLSADVNSALDIFEDVAQLCADFFRFLFLVHGCSSLDVKVQMRFLQPLTEVVNHFGVQFRGLEPLRKPTLPVHVLHLG